ncbi:MAG: hypothetical protein OEM91_16165 [Hyphomicrobiales bacterium]|nr:hypothetical protein [Hyphomicrobiales bacterium]
MPFITDTAFDSGLSYIDTNGTRVDICYTAEPTNYTEATSTNSCGNKTGLNTGAPEAGATDGRRVIVPAITDGSVSATQTADWWGLTDGTSLFLAAGDLSAPQSVTSGNTFTLDAISITFRDAA